MFLIFENETYQYLPGNFLSILANNKTYLKSNILKSNFDNNVNKIKMPLLLFLTASVNKPMFRRTLLWTRLRFGH